MHLIYLLQAYTDALRGDVKAVGSSLVCLPEVDAGERGSRLVSAWTARSACAASCPAYMPCQSVAACASRAGRVWPPQCRQPPRLALIEPAPLQSLQAGLAPSLSHGECFISAVLPMLAATVMPACMRMVLPVPLACAPLGEWACNATSVVT